LRKGTIDMICDIGKTGGAKTTFRVMVNGKGLINRERMII